MNIKLSTLCVSEKFPSTVLPTDKTPIIQQGFAPKSHVQPHVMSFPAVVVNLKTVG